MFLHQFYTPGLAINSYLIGDTNVGHAAIIDPTRDVDRYIDFTQKQGMKITHILETHVHADFVSGAKELKARLKGKPLIHCSAMGGEAWTPSYADKKVRSRDTVDVGSIRLQALHTPGHTPEHIIWLCFDLMRSSEIPCLAFTGDLLFVGGVGRPDLLGKNVEKQLALQLYKSLFDEIDALPDFLEIYPGHGAGSLCGKGLSARPTSTLGYERKFNPALFKLPIVQWISNLLKDTPAAPINFQRLKQLNLVGPSLEIDVPEKAPKVIIDLRHPEVFAQGHMKRSLNIPYGGTFCNWVSSMLAENVAIELVGESREQIDAAAANLFLIGFDRVMGNIAKGDERLPLETVEGLYEKIQAGESPYIMDVRTPMEWQAGHIAKAEHIELADVPRKLEEIPKTGSIAVICGSGYRASIAASLLKKSGFGQVANVKGGMTAWRQAGLPIERSNE